MLTSTYKLLIQCILIDVSYFLFVLIMNECLIEFSYFMKISKDISYEYLHVQCKNPSIMN